MTDDDLLGFLELSGELFYVFDPKEGLRWANESGRRALGDGSDGDLPPVGDGEGDLLTPTEIRVVSRDGSSRWLEWSEAPDPSTGLLCATARDVTARRAVLDLMSKNERLVRTILDQSAAAIFVKDLDGRYVLANPSFLASLGIAEDQVIGRTAGEIWGEALLTDGTVDRRVIDTGAPVTQDDVVEIDGQARTVMTVRFPLRDDKGAVVGIAGIASDITDRTEVEQKLFERERLLDTIVRACPDIVTVLDEKGRVSEVSQASARILGYDIEEPVHDELAALIHPDDLDPVYREYGRLLSLENPFLDVHYRVRHRQGHWVTLHTRGQAIVGRDGHAAGAVVVSRDVTADLAFQEELERAVASAERASVAKSEFLSRMSHELRTPLNSVLGFAQVLELDPLADQQHEAVGHILRAGRHLLNLIDEVLDIDRIESGRLEMAIDSVPIRDVVDDALDLTRPAAEDRNITLAADLSRCPTDAHVRADRQRLLQVLLNLLSNAIKYSGGGDRIDVSVHCYSDRTVVSVHDTGPGIDPADVERAFRPFDRLGAERTGVEGTGMGLSVSKYLTEQMGASLEIDPTVRGGSTFVIELPTTEAPPSPVKIDAETPVPTDVVARVRILHIEDNATNLELVEQVLSRSPGIELLAAMTGSLGLELARAQRPDLILLDLHLPDLSGIEVLDALRADPGTARIPVVVVSADATPDQIRRLKGSGVVAYLTKPIDVGELVQTVEAAVGAGAER